MKGLTRWALGAVLCAIVACSAKLHSPSAERN
jgi:hypothetical protein